MFETKRRQGESIESLLRRFKQGLLRGKVLVKAQENKFYQKDKNKRERKEDTLRRKRTREKKEYLIKTGKLKDVQEKYKGRTR